LNAIIRGPILDDEMSIEKPTSTISQARAAIGFWAVAFAFTAAMAFTTVPTPLWSLYAQRDHLSSLTVTLAFAAYAVAVAVSLFLAAYLGLAGPVIGLGALTQIASTRVSLLVFSGLLALGIFAAAPALLGGASRGPRAFAQPQPTSR
jgi:hypothetical protein